MHHSNIDEDFTDGIRLLLILKNIVPLKPLVYLHRMERQKSHAWHGPPTVQGLLYALWIEWFCYMTNKEREETSSPLNLQTQRFVVVCQQVPLFRLFSSV